LKKILLLSLVVLFVLGLTTVASAAGISVVNTAVAGEGGYSTPTASENPHGDYSPTSNKCKTCHAVHGASATGEALLRSTKANACVYCHVSTNFSIAHPYGTDPALYQSEYENNHASTHQTSGYNGCTSCHAVHGANVWSSAADSIDVGMILRADPGATIGAPNGQGAIAAPVTTLTDFCRDCHDGTNRSGTGYTAGATSNTDSTCAGGCHKDQMLVSNFNTPNGVSHIMTGTLKTGAAQVANLPSSECKSCHSGGTITDGKGTPGNSFPHITSGADFLKDTYDMVTTKLDSVCLDCHQWAGAQAGATSGVGSTF
jgi:predicted CXXCH cytochrome family protein